MANEEGHRGPEGLEPDPLAEQLAPDGAAVLVGILGKGPTDEDWYLYLNIELTRRVEFRANDVRHSEKIREDDSPFLGTQSTRVYLRRGARVVYTTTRSREVQAEFLGGAIAESSLAASLGMTEASHLRHRPRTPPTLDALLCPRAIEAARYYTLPPTDCLLYCEIRTPDCER